MVKRNSDSDSQAKDKSGADLLRILAWGIMTTHPDEIGCEECFEQMDRFVEMVLNGEDPATVMPLVQDHLHRCKGCWEEYEALLISLRAIS